MGFSSVNQINIKLSASVTKFLFGCTLLQSIETSVSGLCAFTDPEFKSDLRKTLSF